MDPNTILFHDLSTLFAFVFLISQIALFNAIFLAFKAKIKPVVLRNVANVIIIVWSVSGIFIAIQTVVSYVESGREAQQFIIDNSAEQAQFDLF